MKSLAVLDILRKAEEAEENFGLCFNVSYHK